MFIFTYSCNSNGDEDKCISNTTAFVTSVNSTETANVDEEVSIEVSFQVNNGCGGFGKFNETVDGNTRFIEVEALYKGCICTQSISTITVDYSFIPESPGDYQLNFKSSSSDDITVSLKVD